MIKLNFRRKAISQLRLEGFSTKSQKFLKTKVLAVLMPFVAFLQALFQYLLKKLTKLGKWILHLGVSTARLARDLKALVVKKLIWSRGRLGRPIANLVILSVALVVFTFGEILSGSRLVNSQEVNPDFLSNITDIIPNTNTTLTLVPEARKRNEEIIYTISGGDTLSSIGQQFKISTDALKYVNSLTDTSILTVGDTITIPPVSGLVHTVEDGDTLESIAEKYSVASQAVADFNYILDISQLAVGSELVIPGAQIPEIPVYIPPTPIYTQQPQLADIPNLGDGFIWPTTTRIISQYFSWYHNGLDIAVPWSWGLPPLFASSGGTVTRAGWDPWGLGLHVAIDHGNGYETVYGHMSRIDVGYGQRVSKGQTIGIMGSTGRSSGPHVHLTLKYGGVPQDPLRFIN